VNSLSGYSQVASFTATPDSGCSPLSVTFTNTSTGGVHFFWEFGDGNTYLGNNPTHLYTSPLSFLAKLSVFDSSMNLLDNAVQLIEAFHSTGEFISDTVGCQGQSKSFFSTSRAASYDWDFGDGNTGSGSTVQHIFAANGVYTVRLIVDILCLKDTTYKDILITDTIPGTLSYFINPASDACPGQPVNLQTNANNPTWIISDGTTSSQKSWTHAFDSVKTYDIDLVGLVCGQLDTVSTTYMVSDSGGTGLFGVSANPAGAVCPGRLISFRGLGVWPQLVKRFRWEFGDSVQDTMNIRSNHNYGALGTKQVTLYAQSYCGQWDTAITSVPVFGSLTPDATFDHNHFTQSFCTHEEVRLSASNFTYKQYDWDFDDGTFETTTFGASSSHYYTNLGTYDAMLTVTNRCGNQDTKPVTNPLVVDNNSPWVMSNFIVSPNLVCPGDKIWLRPQLPVNELVSHKWRFGDGTSDTSLFLTSKTYDLPGTYTIRLIVEDVCGRTDSTDYAINVSSTNLPSSNLISANPQTGNPGVTVSFSSNQGNHLTVDGGNGVVEQLERQSLGWLSIPITYDDTGTYQAMIVASNTCGWVDTAYKIITVTENTTDLEISNTQLCARRPANITANRRDYAAYFWDFGDGQSDSGEFWYIAHTYCDTGTYLVRLIARHGLGFSDTAYWRHYIHCDEDALTPNLWRNPLTTICTGDSIQLTTDSKFTPIYWDFGNGQKDTGVASVKVAYDHFGLYKVQLTAGLGCGKQDTAYTYVKVAPGSGAVSSFSGSTKSGEYYANEEITFRSTGVTSGFPFWDLGDGTTDSGLVVTHRYQEPGIYRVVLRVQNDCGRAAFSFQDIEIVGSNNAAGTVYFQDLGTLVTSGIVQLIPKVTGYMQAVDTAAIDANGNFLFDNVPPGDHLLLAWPDTSLYPTSFPTFLGDALDWRDATSASVYSDTSGIAIITQEVVGSGNQTITLEVQLGNQVIDSKTSGDLLSGIPVLMLSNTHDTVVSGAITSGITKISALSDDRYKFYVGMPGIPTDTTYTILVSNIFPFRDTIIGSIDSDLVRFSERVYNHIVPSRDHSFWLQVFPNPTSGKLKIRTGLNRPLSTAYEIVDVLGRVIYQEGHPARPLGTYLDEIDLKQVGVQPGVYWLVVSGGQGAQQVLLVVTD
jgi:PKD repeat protein